MIGKFVLCQVVLLRTSFIPETLYGGCHQSVNACNHARMQYLDPAPGTNSIKEVTNPKASLALLCPNPVKLAVVR